MKTIEIVVVLAYLSVSLNVYSVYISEDEYIENQTIKKGLKYAAFWPYYLIKHTLKYIVNYLDF